MGARSAGSPNAMLLRLPTSRISSIRDWDVRERSCGEGREGRGERGEVDPLDEVAGGSAIIIMYYAGV